MATRSFTSQTVNIANAGTDSGVVEGTNFAFYAVLTPAVITGAVMRYLVSVTRAGTYRTLCDKTGTPVADTAVVANRGYDCPPELAAWPYWKIQMAAQGQSTDLVVCKKA
jgi:hypothetical protein